VTRAIAEFICSIDPGSIPDRDREAAERSCFDTLGVILAGSVQPVGRLITAEVEERGGSAEATVLATGEKYPAPLAAFANGVMAHALDCDDFGAHGHPSGTLFTALLAVAELGGDMSGRDFLGAYCIGFEVAASLRACCHYDQADGGFHLMAVFGSLAATAACCRALGFDRDTTMMALAIGASETGGLIANFGTMTKHLHMGMAAENGLRAALLAREGFSGAEDIIEGRQGFCEAFFGLGTYDLAPLADTLGSPFKVADSLTIKKYPCCGANHGAIDAVLAAMNKSELKYDDVDWVEVNEVSHTMPPLLFLRPRTGLEGMFSLPYAVGLALLKGTVEVGDFTDEAIGDPAVGGAMDKVRLSILPRWDPESMYGRGETNPIILHLRDGTTISSAVSRSEMLGSPRNPLSEATLAAKFKQNAMLVLPREDVEGLARRWRGLGDSESITELVGELAEQVRSAAGTSAEAAG